MIRALGIYAALCTAVTAIAVACSLAFPADPGITSRAIFIAMGFLVSGVVSAALESDNVWVSFGLSLIASWILTSIGSSIGFELTGEVRYLGYLAFAGAVTGCVIWLLLPMRLKPSRGPLM